MKGDVAAIVYESSAQGRRGDHCRENLLRYSAGDGGHRRDEALSGEGQHCGVHAARDHTFRPATRIRYRRSEKCKLIAKLCEQAVEAPPRGHTGVEHGSRLAIGLDDEVDRSLAQVQPFAIGQKLHGGTFDHGSNPQSGNCALREPLRSRAARQSETIFIRIQMKMTGQRSRVKRSWPAAWCWLTAGVQ